MAFDVRAMDIYFIACRMRELWVVCPLKHAVPLGQIAVSLVLPLIRVLSARRLVETPPPSGFLYHWRKPSRCDVAHPALSVTCRSYDIGSRGRRSFVMSRGSDSNRDTCVHVYGTPVLSATGFGEEGKALNVSEPLSVSRESRWRGMSPERARDA